MKNIILIAAATLIVGPFAQASSYRVKCWGENNNPRTDQTLVLEAKIKVSGRVAEIEIQKYAEYVSTEARESGVAPILTIGPTEAVGSHQSRRTDENEDGRLDSTVRTFGFDIIAHGQSLNLVMTNQGLGADKLYTATILRAGSPLRTWSYCKVK